LGYALLESTGVYYGTPFSSIDRFAQDKSAFQISPTLLGASKLKERSGCTWIHLDIDTELRRERLNERNTEDETEINGRMSGGDTAVVRPELGIDFVISVNQITPRQLFDQVKTILNERRK
jgi:guanylate kinase